VSQGGGSAPVSVRQARGNPAGSAWYAAVSTVQSKAGSCPASLGAAVSDVLLDPFARGRVVDRLDPAALQVGNDSLQALPPPINVQQGLGLVEDPVVSYGLGHGLRVSPSRAGLRPTIPPCSTRPTVAAKRAIATINSTLNCPNQRKRCFLAGYYGRA
jgi:hypothetical protein